MSKNVRVVVDAMGGDHAPVEIIKGAVEALQEAEDIQLILVGDEKRIQTELQQYSYPKDRLQVIHASEVIETAEHPVAAIRRKKDSSIVVGMKLVKDGKADAFVSAGSSGAVLVGGVSLVGRLPGIERAPFASLIPTEKGVSLLLDCGANVDVRPDHMVQFAQMGSIYMRDVMGIKKPQVGILNIGAEEEKGNALVKETFPLLKDCSDIQFIGSVEARDVPAGAADVIVCDGFAGNIVLKMYEGTASVLLRAVKTGLMSSLKSKIGGLLIKSTLKTTLKAYDASIYGGAPVLGLKGLVVKTHGSAKAGEVHNTVLQCRTFYEQRISDKINTSVAMPLAKAKEEKRLLRKTEAANTRGVQDGI